MALSRQSGGTSDQVVDRWLKFLLPSPRKMNNLKISGIAFAGTVVDKNLAGREDLAKEGESIREHDHHNREHQLEGGH